MTGNFCVETSLFIKQTYHMFTQIQTAGASERCYSFVITLLPALRQQKQVQKISDKTVKHS